MKKSWLALILMPCLSFAAYPIYENEFSESAIAGNEVVQYGLAEEFDSVADDAISYENEEVQDEAVAFEQDEVILEESEAVYEQPVRKAPQRLNAQRKAARSKAQKREAIVYEEEMVEDFNEEYVEEPVAPVYQQKRVQKSKGAISQKKQTPAKKRLATKNNQKRVATQKQRQNSNRPKVIYRSEIQEQEMESTISDNENEMQEEQVVAPRAKRTVAAKRYTNKMPLRSKYAKYREKQGKSHHPGKRPLE